MDFLSFSQKDILGHHHAEVYDFETVASQNHAHDVLTYIMHISLYRGQQHLSRRAVTVGTLCFDVGLQYGHSLFHGACRLHHLWKKHLTFSKQLAHQIHALHQGALYDVHSLGVGLQGLVEEFFQSL